MIWLNINNTFYFPEPEDRELFHMNSKHNNLRVLVLVLFHSFCIRKRTDMHQWAWFLFRYVRIQDM